jgi:hypothetical protein
MMRGVVPGKGCSAARGNQGGAGKDSWQARHNVRVLLSNDIVRRAGF